MGFGKTEELKTIPRKWYPTWRAARQNGKRRSHWGRKLTLTDCIGPTPEGPCRVPVPPSFAAVM